MDIKIIDFGLAKQLDPKKEIKTTAGSPEFVGKLISSNVNQPLDCCGE